MVPDYDAFRQHKRVGHTGKRMGKIESGMSIKRGCQRHFYAKQVYMDNSLCQLIYKETTHANKNGDICHGVNVAGFRHALGRTLSVQKKDELNNLLWQGFTATQVMQQHREHVCDMTLKNAPVIRDTFVMPQDVRNLANQMAEDLWKRHPNETMNVRMWKEANEDLVFKYQEHGQLNINATEQDNTPFTIGIQTDWQFKQMMKYGHGDALAMDATFGTSDTRVRHFLLSQKYDIFHDNVARLTVLKLVLHDLPAVPFVYYNGV